MIESILECLVSCLQSIGIILLLELVVALVVCIVYFAIVLFILFGTAIINFLGSCTQNIGGSLSLVGLLFVWNFLTDIGVDFWGIIVCNSSVMLFWVLFSYTRFHTQEINYSIGNVYKIRTKI